jgi:hypothetical protein
MPPAGFEPAIPASERPQTHAFDRAATGICSSISYRQNIFDILYGASSIVWGFQVWENCAPSEEPDYHVLALFESQFIITFLSAPRFLKQLFLIIIPNRQN